GRVSGEIGSEDRVRFLFTHDVMRPPERRIVRKRVQETAAIRLGQAGNVVRRANDLGVRKAPDERKSGRRLRRKIFADDRSEAGAKALRTGRPGLSHRSNPRNRSRTAA